MDCHEPPDIVVEQNKVIDKHTIRLNHIEMLIDSFKGSVKRYSESNTSSRFMSMAKCSRALSDATMFLTNSAPAEKTEDESK